MSQVAEGLNSAAAPDFSRLWRRCIGSCVAGVYAGLTLIAAGQPTRALGADRPTSDDVEAAYLYNFGRFVRWPAASSHGPLQICVAGKDPFAQTVSRLISGERVGDRALEVRTLERPAAVTGCSILFVGGPERARLNVYLAAADGKPILTVSDAPDFVARGGIIQFDLEDHHVRFAVNLDAANRNGVGLSSELLKVAVSVTGGPEGAR